MSDQMRRAERFRGLHIPGKPLVLFNIWDAGSAKAVATAGAKAIATGSWSVANANGFADGEHIPFALVIDNLRRIVAATDLPVTIDLESGYGDTSEAVDETIRLAIEAGAVGCNLEDSFPAKDSTISAFTADDKTGVLTPVPGSPYAAGTSLGGLAVTPAGTSNGNFFLYAADPLAKTVRAYTIDGNTGALSPIPGSPFPAGSAPMLLTVVVP